MTYKPIKQLREDVVRAAMQWAKHHAMGHYGTYAMTCARMKKACAALAAREKELKK